MNVEIRPMQKEDFDAVVEIDEKVFKTARPDYYKARFAWALDQKDSAVVSLVAEADGKAVAFVMGELYTGEYGIPANTAKLVSIGVHPEYQGKSIGKQLMEEFVACLCDAEVEKLHTLVGLNDWQLMRFFTSVGFGPAKTVNLELNL